MRSSAKLVHQFVTKQQECKSVFGGALARFPFKLHHMERSIEKIVVVKYLQKVLFDGLVSGTTAKRLT